MATHTLCPSMLPKDDSGDVTPPEESIDDLDEWSHEALKDRFRALGGDADKVDLRRKEDVLNAVHDLLNDEKSEGE